MHSSPESPLWSHRRESWTAQAEDARDYADIDYARVIHSASFRRLQGKTQILNLGDSDFYRTRLTHSLEVAQIAGGLARQLAKDVPEHSAAPLLPDRSLIHAIGCTHDFGHPPFGHGGEVALNYCMRDAGGFEGNGQTLRILARLESFSQSAGANLSRRMMLGVLKYPVAFSAVANPDLRPALLSGPSTLRLIDASASKPPKCYLDSEADVVEWICQPLSDADRALFQSHTPQPGKHGKALHKSLDCSIMDVADDIAYGVHDLEDAIALDLITRDSFARAVADHCPSFLDAMKAKYPGESANDVFGHMLEGLFGGEGTRKRFIGRLVHHFITAVDFVEMPEFAEPLLRWRVAMRGPQRAFLSVLQQLVVREVITSPAVQHLEFKGQTMVVAVFEAMQADPARLLPREVLARYDAAGGAPRVICDYVAAMTDTALLKNYERLFSPRMGSVFDRI
ncbi:deoxyguanosinetriphosphate triphosphohydrolase family protein [Novosphingobium umbonatum]|uniref:Deoxyguanosinetriphosphate triphosphohydrolase family protein n=1 Tax=Novosphingobium umbonatum TaxID=1908524 RepID=A0A3S2Y8H6_9SPHN|nr:anti-phage deoxyguanosine triphosphatase [Novosphingobium umbonatum]RVU04728.1 deoxyguanosinetriphosphate triphosphohydrolase family protein [Novosphingobium umbonatum]